jgi:hypothetical protein
MSRISQIDKIIADASLSSGPAASKIEGGFVMIHLESAEIAERLLYLLCNCADDVEDPEP